uniref:Uncharacterized protein n=1 Tax=Anguilla anguilla TaxID=7936 RepID=A0A0E9QTD1_ANGAN
MMMRLQRKQNSLTLATAVRTYLLGELTERFAYHCKCGDCLQAA